ncbi:Fic family protein [Streptococcus pluranimalium]|uniref:Fic family protein n=1 Tax=Streptococcus pluranimalium TaxID=82348 RepID=UPI003F693D34
MKSSYDRVVNDLTHRNEFWDIAFSLQKTAGLLPSEYLRALAKRHVDGEIDYPYIYSQITRYYQKVYLESYELNKEADIVSVRIVEYLENAQYGFKLTSFSLRAIHRFLFDGITAHQINAGEYRCYNIAKEEIDLKSSPVCYSIAKDIEDVLSWRLSQEIDKDYNKLSLVEKLLAVEHFISDVWKIYPFSKGNTRTIAVFAVLYLRSRGFKVDNIAFAKNAEYFRDALVLANTSNRELQSFKALDDFFFVLVSNEQQDFNLNHLRL